MRPRDRRLACARASIATASAVVHLLCIDSVALAGSSAMQIRLGTSLPDVHRNTQHQENEAIEDCLRSTAVEREERKHEGHTLDHVTRGTRPLPAALRPPDQPTGRRTRTAQPPSWLPSSRRGCRRRQTRTSLPPESVGELSREQRRRPLPPLARRAMRRGRKARERACPAQRPSGPGP